MKKCLAILVVLVMVFSLTAGSTLAKGPNKAAPAVASELLREAGIRGGIGQYISEVAKNMGPRAEFGEVSKEDRDDYREEVAGFLKGLGVEIDVIKEEPSLEYTLRIDKEGEGTVKVDGKEVELPYRKDFDEGTEVEIEALPGEDWFFLEWREDLESIDSVLTLTMEEDKKLTAEFMEIVEDKYVYNMDSENWFETIDGAIDEAIKGDTLLVMPGTYEEDLTIGVEDVTLKSVEKHGAVIKGDTIRITADGVTLEGFHIDSEDPGRAIGPTSSDGTIIKNNKITGSLRGVQGDWYGRPVNLTITGNIFETDYGVAGTEDVTGLHIKGNTFDTLEEAIGLGVGVTVVNENGEEVEDYVKWLEDNNEFIKDGGVVDYR